jgi:hypothetical protein
MLAADLHGNFCLKNYNQLFFDWSAKMQIMYMVLPYINYPNLPYKIFEAS